MIAAEGGDLVPKEEEEEERKDEGRGRRSGWEGAGGIEEEGALLVRPDGVVARRWKSMKNVDDCKGELHGAINSMLCN